MEQRFDGKPRAEVRLEGRRVIRSEVAHDWGSLLRWQVRKNGQVVGTAPARMECEYEFSDKSPGTYEVVLQMWKYIDYRKNPDGEFVNSHFVDVSNKVSYTI